MFANDRAPAGGASFRFFPPGQLLAPYVSFLYASVVSSLFSGRVVASRVPELEHQLVFVIEEGHAFPGGQALSHGLRASLFFQPAHLRVVQIPRSIREAIGASLRPAALRLLLPRGAPNFSGAARISIEDLWGYQGRDLLDELINAGDPLRRLGLFVQRLTELARRQPPIDVTAERSLHLLGSGAGGLSLDDVADRCGVSGRALRRHLTVETGLSPKRVDRLVRLRRALREVTQSAESLAAISAANDFADQAHMSREFRALLAASPDMLRRSLSAHRSMPRFQTERELLGTGLLLQPAPRQR